MTITYRPGCDLLEDAEHLDAVVNTVNCVGVMGKGLAKQFKETFPDNAAMYERACANHRLNPGIPYITRSYGPGRLTYIIHAPTKDHWRCPSKIEWIEDICAGLSRFLVENKSISRIGIPKLGCANGGLRWDDVHPIIVEWLGDLPNIEIVVYGDEVPALG